MSDPGQVHAVENEGMMADLKSAAEQMMQVLLWLEWCDEIEPRLHPSHPDAADSRQVCRACRNWKRQGIHSKRCVIGNAIAAGRSAGLAPAPLQAGQASP
jgi:hypothetical protein